ncbi:TFIIA-alpha and beta-like factor isoform X1 [Labrus mixtus]|uniref:TFIIA-alpha and beta-like factor isoform X1 n=1 Tax=Labrus mixtus TaxID=508554 RepID=UPI0029C01717|nr:TFIIA-alpha and beta-like factor isoform X1 [Labrus mixtus]
MRELFLDEGLEDRVLDDLRHLWESKMMQSKAMEDFRKNNINSSNFVLQLPASYTQTDQDVTGRASVVIPASQTIHSFPRLKAGSETLATFSLPAGLAYPVQIPAGVTLQTASGQLYKVNVPVVVTQQPVSQPAQKVTAFRGAAAPQPAAAPPKTAAPPQEVEPSPAPAASVTQQPPQNANLPPSQETSALQQPPVPAPETSQPQTARSPDLEVPQVENEPSPHPEPVDLSMTASPCTQLLDFQIRAEEALAQTAPLQTRDIDDILKEVIEEEREKAERARSQASTKNDDQAEPVLELELDYSYSDLSDIVQLDGAADNSDLEEDEGGVPLEENDFLGIINAEAIKALQEGEGSSDGNSISSSDSEGADELADIVEEDPLNSGDDVMEQDIPDLFDTDNVIVCQYDKIHRSKNRWKFHLKDGVMCYGGRDYVFSKAVGEAEW